MIRFRNLDKIKSRGTYRPTFTVNRLLMLILDGHFEIKLVGFTSKSSNSTFFTQKIK